MDDRNLSFNDYMKMSESEKCKRYAELSEHDRFRARLSQPISGEGVMCNGCAHYHNDFTCDAYPNGIPGDLVVRGEHVTPFPGDRGIRYRKAEQ